MFSHFIMFTFISVIPFEECLHIEALEEFLVEDSTKNMDAPSMLYFFLVYCTMTVPENLLRTHKKQ